MLSQSQIKHITALKVKKFREEFNQFIAEGTKLVMDMADSQFQVAGIYASGEWIVANLPLIRKKNIPVFETVPREMERLSALSTPSPVLAVVNIPSDNDLKSKFDALFCTSSLYGAETLVLALDDIRDPGNFGTIIRIADWFGIGTILCSESCVDLYSPKVVQASMGSITRVTVIRCKLAETLNTLSGRFTLSAHGEGLPVYGTFLEGDSVFSQTLTEHGIVVIGNESRGISPDLVPFITHKLFIPSFGSSAPGKAESLNASIAAAIICAEFRRGK
ncbi:MAG: RNA methyltransferase [Bacteroidetes bacterium]|nr:RNA methyltransferase [Bacteroidota bacterium]